MNWVQQIGYSSDSLPRPWSQSEACSSSQTQAKPSRPQAVPPTLDSEREYSASRLAAPPVQPAVRRLSAAATRTKHPVLGVPMTVRKPAAPVQEMGLARVGTWRKAALMTAPAGVWAETRHDVPTQSRLDSRRQGSRVPAPVLVAAPRSFPAEWRSVTRPLLSLRARPRSGQRENRPRQGSQDRISGSSSRPCTPSRFARAPAAQLKHRGKIQI